MFQVEQYLCQINETLKQILTLLGGAPSAAVAPRYTIGTGGYTFSQPMGPLQQVIYPNPRRANLVVGNIGPGDVYISGQSGNVTGFPVLAGMIIAFPGITEPVYGYATMSGTTLYWLEVVAL